MKIGAGVLALAVLGGGLLIATSPRLRAYFSGTTASRSSLAARLAVPGLRSTVGPEPARAAARPDTTTRLPVPITTYVPTRLPFEGVPAGWHLREFTGRADVQLLRDDGRLAVKLRSERGSFALHRDVTIDLGVLPVLAWAWKVTRLPSGGDVRQAASDDQAAQVYVIFPRWPAPRTQSDVIGYVWDSRAPVDTRVASPKAPNVRVIVVESGPGGMGRWLRQRRNVAEDYVALFGRPAPPVGHLALMSDSNETRSEAEVTFADVAFERAAAGRKETPTSVLR